jgi:hypothetical protein
MIVRDIASWIPSAWRTSTGGKSSPATVCQPLTFTLTKLS